MRGLGVCCSAALLFAGCSAQDVYEFGHDIGESKADCEALTSVDERQQCEDQFARNYETYQQERAAL
ncbi:MAG: hypothetical protein GKR90_17905 [Pseudomonadales bacterium]|nr:hypothetical protein [Pseudomonadales bacterium]